jgi:membrane protein required for colicin V production
MTWVDWLVLVGVAAGAYRGYKTGVLRQVIAIAGWFVAFILALQLMQAAGRVLVASLPVDEHLAPLVGFLLVLVAVRLALFLARQAAESILDAFHLSFVNRLGGGAFGAFQGVLIVSLLLLVLGYLGVPQEQTRRASAAYEPVAAVLPETWDAVAEHVPRVRGAAEQFGRRVEEELPGRSG